MGNNQIRKVLIVTPSLNVGGIGRHLSVFAEYFHRKGIEVSMLSCLNSKNFYKINSSIKVTRFSSARKRGVIGALYFYSKLIFFIRKNITKENPDFILVFGELFNPLVLFAAIGTNTPVFIGDMTSADYDHGVLINTLRKMTYPIASGLVCQTKFVQEYRNKEFNNRLNTIVLDNPIRPIKEYDLSREKIILYVGRFAWEKSPNRLIEAFANIKDKNGWHLWMAGDGPMLNDMKQLASVKDCSSKIKFLGKVKNVDKLFAKASIFVLPSILEGFPNAMCEAMIAGLPVICFNGFPSEEIINNDVDGIIIDNASGIKGLTQSLIDLMQNPKKRELLGINAKKLRTRLDAEQIVDKFLDFVSLKLNNSK